MVYEIEMDNLNYDYGFRAMRDMLARMNQDDFERQYQITEAEKVAGRTQGERNEFAVDHLIELYEYSDYQDAAHSMVAVGMIAPFVESLFREAFREFDIELPMGHLVRNIIKSISELDWCEYMPEDLEVTLTALFAYRNKMFHHGFEWPSDIRNNFAQRLEKSGWPSKWFSRASTKGDPWMFYVTDTFINHCIETIEKIEIGIEKLKFERMRDQL
ncbi:MAG: hypothetical protein OXC83_02395 [Chloroflexi bacterium]|nr:hypothetical protein [Chloroflexota bacterium]